MLRVSWIERRINDSTLSEINESREIFKNIIAKQWNMMGRILRHENELFCRIIVEKMESKRGQGRPCTSFVKQMIANARLLSYNKLKRLAKNREEWRAHVQLQNQP